MDFDRLQNVIQKLCDKRGIKPRTAYEESGVGRSFYDNIRKGSVPSVEKLQALAVYFNVSVDYLIGNTDVPEVNHQSETLSQAGLAAFAALSPAEQEQIRALVQTLAAKDN